MQTDKRRKINYNAQLKRRRRRKQKKILNIIKIGIILVVLFLIITKGMSYIGMSIFEKSTNQIYQEVMNEKSEYPKTLVEAMKTNKELSDFVYHYKERETYKNQKIDVSKEVKKGEIPLFLQWDKRWGYNEYGKSMIGLAGCGPTCLSMVAIGLTQNIAYTPDVVAEYSENNGYLIDGNTAWTLMYEGAEYFGVKGQEIALDEEVIEGYLKNGNPIICSMGPGDFTTSGHFIVLAGIEEGKIVVNDPNSKIRSKKTWSFETIQGQIKNLWVFTKKDKK